MAQERQIVATATSSAGGRVISSPFQFYTTGEDRLRVTSVNSLAGVALKIQSRFVDSFGKVQANSDDHIPNSNRTAKSTEHELGTGALLNLTVFAGTGAPVSGQTFVIVQLIRGSGAAAIVLGTLLQGYVTSVQHLGWPGSPIEASTTGEPYLRAISGTVPAAGADISETVPTGARWELLSLKFFFTTSATVADRKVAVDAVVGGLTVSRSANFATLSASSVGLYTVAPALQFTSDPVRGIYQSGLAQRFLLPSAGRLETNTYSLQAGDQYTAPLYLVREWLEVN